MTSKVKWHKAHSDKHVGVEYQAKSVNLEQKAKECTTHHPACDCREYQHMQLRDAMAAILGWAMESADKTTCHTCVLIRDVAAAALKL